MKTVAGLLIALALCIGAIWIVHRLGEKHEKLEAAQAAREAATGDGSLAGAGEPVAMARDTENAVPRPLPPRQTAPTAEARKERIQERALSFLERDGHPGKLVSVSCDSATCRVEMETDDLDRFAPTYERLQDTAFVDEATGMRLETPTRAGTDGPWRVVFVLTYE